MNLLKKAVINAFVSVAIISAAHAQVIGIDFYNSSATNQTPGTSDVVGPVATAGWYNTYDVNGGANLTPTGGTGISLLDNTGTATGAVFGFTQGGSTLSGGSIYNSGYGAGGSPNGTLTPNQQLYNGSAYAGAAGFQQEVTLKNIPYALYDVYVLVYALDGAVGYPPPTGGVGALTLYTDVTTSPILGATYWFYGSKNNPIPSDDFSYIQATGTSEGTATPDANYVLFSGLTSSSASFDLFSPNHDGNAGAIIAGIQIVETVSVPEPSTYALMMCGVIVLFGFRKMRARFV